ADSSDWKPLSQLLSEKNANELSVLLPSSNRIKWLFVRIRTLTAATERCHATLRWFKDHPIYILISVSVIALLLLVAISKSKRVPSATMDKIVQAAKAQPDEAVTPKPTDTFEWIFYHRAPNEEKVDISISRCSLAG